VIRSRSVVKEEACILV